MDRRVNNWRGLSRADFSWAGLLRRTRTSTALVAVLILSSCGFQLRSYDLDANVQNFVISGMQRAQVTQPLRQALVQLGAEEVQRGASDLIIVLLDQRSERRAVSTAGQARAEEYEMEYAIQYQLLNGQDAALTEPLWIERRRIYRVDRNNIVGSSEEQNILRREMLQDVVGQIVRAIDLVSRQPATAVAADAD